MTVWQIVWGIVGSLALAGLIVGVGLELRALWRER